MDEKRESRLGAGSEAADLFRTLLGLTSEKLAATADGGTCPASPPSSLPCERSTPVAAAGRATQPGEPTASPVNEPRKGPGLDTPQRKEPSHAVSFPPAGSLAFSLGARGECVAVLQHALGLRGDGRFGPRTYEAVAAVERKLGREARGLADREVFAAVGLAWPTEFDRTLALVIELEGTSYGDCNASDIDGAGLTMGICGFTTRHGEAQALIEAFLREAPEGWTSLPPSLMRQIRALIDEAAEPARWEEVLLDAKRRPLRAVQQALAAWGKHPVMRELQRAWARKRLWEPACRTAQRLGVDTPSGRALLFDVWVQNGGWRPAHDIHVERIAGRCVGEIPPSDRLRIMALAVAAAARAPWRADVLSRKLLFARGAAMVHGTFYSLAAQALLARGDLAPCS